MKIFNFLNTDIKTLLNLKELYDERTKDVLYWKDKYNKALIQCPKTFALACPYYREEVEKRIKIYDNYKIENEKLKEENKILKNNLKIYREGRVNE